MSTSSSLNRVAAPCGRWHIHGRFAVNAVVAGLRRSSAGLKMLCATAFVLAAAPRMRVMVGPVPLYLIDICAALALWFAMRSPRQAIHGTDKLRTAVLAFGAFIVLSQANNAIMGRWVLEPAYMLVRYGFALSVFFSTQRLVTTLRDVMLVGATLSAGLLVTSVLLIMVSLPPTRGIATSYIFSNPMLEPVSQEGPMTFGDTERAHRGRSLVGTSTLSGGFVCTLWPLSLMVASSTALKAFWRRLGFVAAIVAPFGAIMTYARGAVLGMALSLLALSSLAKGSAKRYALVAVAVTTGVFHVIGWNSELFMFDRLQRRFEIAVKNPFEGNDERERSMSYIEPFKHLTSHPLCLVVGEGNTATRRPSVAWASAMSDKATHSSFAWSYYGFGMTAACLNVFIFASTLWITFKSARAARLRHTSYGLAATCLLGAILGMASWWLFGHGTVSLPRGMMFYMLMVGLVAAFAELKQNGSVIARNTRLRLVFAP